MIKIHLYEKKSPITLASYRAFPLNSVGTVIWCFQHQLTKDRQCFQHVLIFTLKASTTIYFKELEQFDKPKFEVLR